MGIPWLPQQGSLLLSIILLKTKVHPFTNQIVYGYFYGLGMPSQVAAKFHSRAVTLRQGQFNLQSLNYLLSGTLQEKFADS